MKSLNKIWNTIKDFHLIKYEIINGTIESHKFELLMKFDGIIQKSNTMTINDLAIEMREGFKRVDEKFSDMKQYIDTRFAEVDEKFGDMKQYTDTRFDVIETDIILIKEEVARHSDILERNNLK